MFLELTSTKATTCIFNKYKLIITYEKNIINEKCHFFKIKYKINYLFTLNIFKKDIVK